MDKFALNQAQSIDETQQLKTIIGQSAEAPLLFWDLLDQCIEIAQKSAVPPVQLSSIIIRYTTMSTTIQDNDESEIL